MSRLAALLTALVVVLACGLAVTDHVEVATFVLVLITLGHVCDMRDR